MIAGGGNNWDHHQIGGYSHIEGSMKHRPQHKRRQFCGARHWKLLSGNTHGLLWIYENALQYIFTENHWSIWSTIKIKKCTCLWKNQTRCLWIATSWSSYKCKILKFYCSSRILQTLPHTSTLAERYKTYSVHIGCGWFWGQICRARTWQST